LVFGSLAFAAACVLAEKLRQAIVYVRASGECLLQEAGLSLHGVLDLLVRCLIIAAFLPPIALLLSSGIDGKRGLTKQLDFSQLPVFALIYHLFFLLWSLEVCTAISQYIVAWVTHTWYFLPYRRGAKKDEQCAVLCQALYTALRYHLGTMLLGALLTMILRVPRVLTSRYASHLRRELEEDDVDGYGSGYGQESLKRKQLEGWRGWILRLQVVKKDAYLDVVVNSTSFFEAAQNAADIESKHRGTLSAIRMSQWVFVFVGYVAITSAGAFLAWLAMGLNTFSKEESASYISDPWVAVVAAGLLSFSLAVSWMTVFDTVGDTISFCYTLDQSLKATRRKALRDMAHQMRLEREQEEQSTWYGWLVGNGIRCIYPEGDMDLSDEEAGYTPKALHDIVGPRRVRGTLLGSGSRRQGRHHR